LRPAFAFLQGVFVKAGVKMWFFDGQFVVECVVKMEVDGHFQGSKNTPRILNLFWSELSVWD
jgi:hypothetical protein